MQLNLFIFRLQDEPFFVFAWLLTVVISITLHELAHGYVAIRHGDHTPIHMGRMTGNPFVHMGGFSIFVLLMFGIAWGQMPVDSTRLRGKYAEAKVAVAGPATNLLLATIALTGLGLWFRFGTIGGSEVEGNAIQFMTIFGSANLMLMIFNLFPVPPLDGSHILANFHHGYARFISDPSRQPFFIFSFMLVFAVSGVLFGRVITWSADYVNWVATVFRT